MLTSVRRKEAIKLKESGLTYAAIGEKFGISRQRAWNIVNGNQKWVNPHPGGTMGRKERERRYISEYMKEQWPNGGWQLNVELGPIPQEYVDRYGLGKAAAIFRPTRPRVDAVKWTKERYYIIEAKIRDIKAGIGDLSYYRGMVPRTPDLPFYDGQELVFRLVVPWMIDWIKGAADAAQVEVVVFHKPWIDAYVKERQHYFTAEYRAERAEKMRLREILGVD